MLKGEALRHRLGKRFLVDYRKMCESGELNGRRGMLEVLHCLKSACEHPAFVSGEGEQKALLPMIVNGETPVGFDAEAASGARLGIVKSFNARTGFDLLSCRLWLRVSV